MVQHPLDPTNPFHPPFMQKDGRAKIGLRLAPDSEWLHRDELHEAQLRRKVELLAVHDDSVACLERGVAASEELLMAIEQWTGQSGNRSLEPIDAAGRLVQEDLCILDGESLVLVAGSVCFPQGWLLSSKIGLSMRAIHAPVPYYESIADPSDKVVHALDLRLRWRMNWFVVGSDKLRSEPGHPLDGPICLHLRFERQTLRRLPKTGAVVFTIRSYISPIETIDGRPELQTGLLRALDTMSDAERTYHGNNAPAELAKDYLRSKLM